MGVLDEERFAKSGLSYREHAVRQGLRGQDKMIFQWMNKTFGGAWRPDCARRNPRGRNAVVRFGDGDCAFRAACCSSAPPCGV